VAPPRLSALLALAVPVRAQALRQGNTQIDPSDVFCQPALGCAAHPRRVAQARYQDKSGDRRQVESPVDPVTITAGVSRVASGPRCLHAVATTPAGPMSLVRSYQVPSASAFPVCAAGRLLHCPFRGLLSVHSRYGLHAHRVAYDPLHRRLQRLRYLHRCFDCYRPERTSSRTGLSPAVDQRLSTAHAQNGAHFRARADLKIRRRFLSPHCDAGLFIRSG
jgi:hypothetical protein